MKIKFFTNGLTIPRTYETRAIPEVASEQLLFDAESVVIKPEFESLYINPSYFFLKHYYSLYGKNNKIEWLIPELILIDKLPEIINQTVKEQPDIIGMGMYAWNEQYNLSLAKQLKLLLPNSTIIMGGPQLTAHKETGFFKKHPYVDYVVYGDGEKAFRLLVDFKSGLIETTDSFVNIVENDNGQEKVYPYEMLRDEQYFNTSPYLSQEEHILESLRYADEKVERTNFIYGTPYAFEIGIEFARGCMYACTFCDWSQNLTHKVTRRKYDWKSDIDFFHRHDIRLSETDANFGQWKEDIEIYDYAASLYDPFKKFRFPVVNTPKLKKDITEYLIRRNVQVYDYPPMISFQDLSEEVLKNIDRPSVSWEDHKILINNLKRDLTLDQFRQVRAQIILGLPGQSVDLIKEHVVQLLLAGVVHIHMGQWVLLPNSPAADKFYQKLHKLEFEDIYIIRRYEQELPNLEAIYADTAGDRSIYGLSSAGKWIIKNKDMSHRDLIIATIIVRLFNAMPVHLKENRTEKEIRNTIDRLHSAAIKQADEQIKLHQPLMDKYNITFLGSYNNFTKMLSSRW